MSNWTFIKGSDILAQHRNGLTIELEAKTGAVFNIKNIPNGLSTGSLRVLTEEAEKEYSQQQEHRKGENDNPRGNLPKMNKPTLSLKKKTTKQ